MINVELIKQLRQETGISIGECKKALEEASGDLEKAKAILKEWGKDIAAKKGGREAGQGIVDSYIHSNHKTGVLIGLKCETDFVAKSDEFKNLAHELCLQFAAMGEENGPWLNQPWIKDASKSVKDLILEAVAKTGENIVLDKVARFQI